VARCARCHDERGDKPLKTGPPLNQRGLSSEQIARAGSGRLRDNTEEERRAVTLYISTLMKPKDSEERAPPKPDVGDLCLRESRFLQVLEGRLGA